MRATRAYIRQQGRSKHERGVVYHAGCRVADVADVSDVVVVVVVSSPAPVHGSDTRRSWDGRSRRGRNPTSVHRRGRSSCGVGRSTIANGGNSLLFGDGRARICDHGRSWQDVRRSLVRMAWLVSLHARKINRKGEQQRLW